MQIRVLSAQLELLTWSPSELLFDPYCDFKIYYCWILPYFLETNGIKKSIERKSSILESSASSSFLWSPGTMDCPATRISCMWGHDSISTATKHKTDCLEKTFMTRIFQNGCKITFDISQDCVSLQVTSSWTWLTRLNVIYILIKLIRSLHCSMKFIFQHLCQSLW